MSNQQSIPPTTLFYYDTPYEVREACLAHDMKFDGDLKLWYAVESLDWCDEQQYPLVRTVAITDGVLTEWESPRFYYRVPAPMVALARDNNLKWDRDARQWWSYCRVAALRNVLIKK